MEDSRIVELYWQRSEEAIPETENKYGRYCISIAENILRDKEDAKECVNDTYLAAWNTIPPHRPEALSTFLGKITRQLSLKKLRDSSVDKRGGGSISVSVDELENCIPAGQSIDDSIDTAEIAKILDSFLETLPVDERRVFLRRYWYFDSIGDISSRFGFGKSKVKMMLKRTRDKLKECLQREDIFI